MNSTAHISLSALTLLLSSPVLCAKQTAEVLGRAPIAVTTTSGNLVSWRTLPHDASTDISFRLTCLKSDGTSSEIDIPCGSASSYLDTKKAQSYKLEVLSQGTIVETLSDILPEPSMRQIHLNRPAQGSTSTGSYTYTPNDCSVGDVDGDGDYEIIVKWDPSNSQDNSKSDYKTGNTIFDCYEITGPDAGQHLWRIDLGVNVRAGAHYSPFLVYDFDGDGKAEFVVKTAPGSKDALGRFVSAAGKTDDIRNNNSNNTDYRNSGGHILKGEEYLTIFSGQTGEALQTIWYWPNHARKAAPGSPSTSYSWTGDSYGNRGHRYNACIAYLSGLDQCPSIVMQRGYYTQAYFWAVDWDGTNLETRWLHQGTDAKSWSVLNAQAQSIKSGSGKSSYGQGVHGISVADVDQDGFDEIIMGSATIDHDGSLLCSTGFGHGDAIHVGKFIPGRPGYQIYMPHEEKGCSYGDDLHDAATGEILYRGYTDKDNGRGLAGDYIFLFDATTGLDKYPGWEMWSGAMSTPMNAITQQQIGKKPDTNFRIYWNGDLYDDSFDGRLDSGSGLCSPRILCWNGSSSNTTYSVSTYGGKPQSCNWTKATPCLSADLYGDWREELILWDNNDQATLNIYSTPIQSKYPVPCLMTDHNYRLGIAWQNSSYNQPPHLGYSLPEALLCRYDFPEGRSLGQIVDTLYVGQPYELRLKVYNAASCSVNNTTMPAGIEYQYVTDDAASNTDDETSAQPRLSDEGPAPLMSELTLSGTPTQTGSFSRTFTLKGLYGHDCKAVVKLVIVEGSGIEEIKADARHKQRYDLLGRPASSHTRLTIGK